MGTTRTDLFTQEQNQQAEAFKAFAHPARIAIIEHLLATGTCINNQLVQELGLAQATVSQHLRELKQLGIIQGQIEGTRMCYCIDPQAWEKLQQMLHTFFNRELPNTQNLCCP